MGGERQGPLYDGLRGLRHSHSASSGESYEVDSELWSELDAVSMTSLLIRVDPSRGGQPHRVWLLEDTKNGGVWSMGSWHTKQNWSNTECVCVCVAARAQAELAAVIHFSGSGSCRDDGACQPCEPSTHRRRKLSVGVWLIHASDGAWFHRMLDRGPFRSQARARRGLAPSVAVLEHGLKMNCCDVRLSQPR